MRESCKYGSVRGADSNGGPYRNRREFITLLGGAAGVAARGAGAAAADATAIGCFIACSDDAAMHSFTAAFVRGLHDLGWTEGRKPAYRVSLGSGNVERLRRSSQPNSSRRSRSSSFVTSGTPIVRLHSRRPAPSRSCSRRRDPVGIGLVASLARPGGNITGLMQFDYSIAAKRLELLARSRRACACGGPRADPLHAAADRQWRAIQSQRHAAVELTAVEIRARRHSRYRARVRSTARNGGADILA